MEEFLGSFLSDWIVDAVIDSVKTIPFLFIVFLFIEIFEHFWANKIKNFLQYSKKEGPCIGAIAASIPQCGFSVVASTLYKEGYITKGTIIAVFLATSDEAIPVLFMYPEYFSAVLPLIIIKLLIAVPTGHLVDILLHDKNIKSETLEEEHMEGCCKHNITSHRKRDFLIHPMKHTAGIFVFILIITLILNFLLERFDVTEFINKGEGVFAPLIAAIIGLIPNCAVSVGLVLMFIKGAISFSTMTSGLMTSSGIGLLVLFKHNKNFKDLAFILFILVLTGFLTGIFLQFLKFDYNLYG